MPSAGDQVRRLRETIEALLKELDELERREQGQVVLDRTRKSKRQRRPVDD